MGTFYAVQGGSRILNASRVDQSGSDNAGVINWLLANNFILAVNINSGGKETAAAQYKLRWRVSGGVFADVAATGAIKFGATDLVNGGTIAAGGRKCSSVGGDTWQTGYEVEGTALSTSIDLVDEYESEVHFSLSCADATQGALYEFELYDATLGASSGTCGVTLTTASLTKSVALTDSFTTTHTAGIKKSAKSGISETFALTEALINTMLQTGGLQWDTFLFDKDTWDSSSIVESIDIEGTAADSFTTSQSNTNVKGGKVSVTETLSAFTENQTAFKGAKRGLTDSIVTVSSESATKGGKVALSDTATFTESETYSVSENVDVTVNLTDSVALAETLTAQANKNGYISDSFITSDSITNVKGGEGSLIDLFTTADNISVSLDRKSGLTDGITLAETLIGKANKESGISDFFTSNDSGTGGIVINSAILDTIIFSDSISSVSATTRQQIVYKYVIRGNKVFGLHKRY